MWWFLLYYVTMRVPSGLVETSYMDGIIRVGDETHKVEDGYSIACVRKRGNLLWFTLEDHNEMKTYSF